MKGKILNLTALLLTLFFVFLLISKPEICKTGIASGILLCGRVIIPSLFPFTMCVIFIMNSGVLNNFEFRVKSTKIKLKTDILFIVLLSFIGGYPIGAKLLHNAVKENKISPNEASNMLNFSVNAGPAFIISAVGNGILNSKPAGVILLLSHILSSLVLFLFSFKEISFKNSTTIKIKTLNPADNFIKSVAEASVTVLSICNFTILFSSINSYIDHLSQNVSFVKVIGLLLEITNALTLTNNVYLISFLLGFGGISVWCQIISIATNFKINFIKFAIFRLLHGILSVGFSLILFKIFPVEISVFSNISSPFISYFHSGTAVGISLFVMSLVFIISVSTKKYAGKIIDDVI